MTDRERTWDLVHARLPAGWHVGPLSYDPARHSWEIVARSPKPGGRRSPPPDYVIGTGLDELKALRNLSERLAEQTR
jgi:hypothetical protein